MSISSTILDKLQLSPWEQELFMTLLSIILKHAPSKQAMFVGISLKYLNRYIKERLGAALSDPFTANARVALHRDRSGLEKKNLIAAYHMDKLQMVGIGKAAHIVLTRLGTVTVQAILKLGKTRKCCCRIE